MDCQSGKIAQIRITDIYWNDKDIRFNSNLHTAYSGSSAGDMAILGLSFLGNLDDLLARLIEGEESNAQ